MASVHIIGAGGFGREVLQYVRDLMAAGSALAPAGFVDDQRVGELEGLPVVKLEEAPISTDHVFIVAVGDPTARRALAERARALGCTFVTIVHPRAYVAESAVIGAGCLISPFAFIGPAARLGDHVAVNVHATVDHDATVGAFTYVAPHACVGGGGTLGEAAALGAHASLAPGATVCPGERVFPGTHVARDGTGCT